MMKAVGYDSTVVITMVMGHDSLIYTPPFGVTCDVNNLHITDRAFSNFILGIWVIWNTTLCLSFSGSWLYEERQYLHLQGLCR